MLVNLKAALAARRMLQADLAVQLKIPQSALSEIVNGRRKPELRVADQIAKILNADRGWLFSERFMIPTPPASSHQEEFGIAGDMV